MKKFNFLILICSVAFMSACESKTDVVDSGTYQGVIAEVEAEKTEIYVTTGDGKRLELYFTDSTTLTNSAGIQVPFEELAEGKKVEVTVEKVGKRLDPISVTILD